LIGNGRATRRELLRRGVVLAAAAPASNLLATRSALARPASARWPTGRLTVADAVRVNPAQFMPVSQLQEWQHTLDDLGLRATDSPTHNQYIQSVASRLEQVGVQQIRTEPVAFTKWAPSSWRLEVVSGPGKGPVPIAAYIPYSGQTPPAGITGPLMPAAIGGIDPLPSLPTGPAGLATPTAPSGQIVLFDVLPKPLADGFFDALDWGAPRQPHHPPGYSPLTAYDRMWIAQPTTPLDQLSDAGFGGAIGILDLPAEAAQGMYMPYDAKLRNLPSLFVDRDTGARLRQVAQAGGTVRLTLEAQVAPTSSPNLIGLIPGQSDELVILECHTDGTNGVEDNGPEAILAICQYLTRLPERVLPRGVLVLLSTGHFAAGDLGAVDFVNQHQDDLIKQAAAELTIEHLGAREWLPGAGLGGGYGLTGNYEIGGSFVSPFSTYIRMMRGTLAAARTTDARVLRPWVPFAWTTPSPGAPPDGLTYPGDGESFWARAGLPAANFITGPNYLLNGGMRVAGMIDIHAVRRQAIAFANLLLQLTRIPRAQLDHRKIG
jgi:hypothetical protein